MGFPNFKQLEDHYASAKDIVIFHLQTVWEAEDVNTPTRGHQEAKKYELKVPVGYDGHVDGGRTSVFMHRYGTGGTPWTIVIDRKGKVQFNERTPGVDVLKALIDKLRK